MRVIKIIAFMVLPVLLITCKKDKEPDKEVKIKAVVGIWHDMGGKDVIYTGSWEGG